MNSTLKIKIFILVFFFLNLIPGQVRAEKKCTRDEAIAAEGDAGYHNNWKSLFKSFKSYGHCDDGAIGEGYSDSVIRILTENWQSLPDLKKLALKDPKFETFVLHHIDFLMTPTQGATLLENTQLRCPKGCESLCRKIEESEQKNIEHAKLEMEEIKAKDLNYSSPEKTIETLYTSLKDHRRSVAQGCYIQELGELINFSNSFEILKNQKVRNLEGKNNQLNAVFVKENIDNRKPLIVKFLLIKKDAHWKILDSTSSEEKQNLDLSTPEQSVHSRYKSWERKDMHSFRKCYARASDLFGPETHTPYKIIEIKRSIPGVFSREGDIDISVEAKDENGLTWPTPYILRRYEKEWRIIDSPEFDDGDFPPDGSAPMYDPTFQPSNP